MRVVKLGENLYEIRLSFWCWSAKKGLVKGLQEIQSCGKTVTVVMCFWGWVTSYIVVTS